jgi:hypothetical protein
VDEYEDEICKYSTQQVNDKVILNMIEIYYTEHYQWLELLNHQAQCEIPYHMLLYE